jgi:hypothetical protein
MVPSAPQEGPSAPRATDEAPAWPALSQPPALRGPHGPLSRRVDAARDFYPRSGCTPKGDDFSGLTIPTEVGQFKRETIGRTEIGQDSGELCGCAGLSALPGQCSGRQGDECEMKPGPVPTPIGAPGRATPPNGAISPESRSCSLGTCPLAASTQSRQGVLRSLGESDPPAHAGRPRQGAAAREQLGEADGDPYWSVFHRLPYPRGGHPNSCPRRPLGGRRQERLRKLSRDPSSAVGPPATSTLRALTRAAPRTHPRSILGATRR